MQPTILTRPVSGTPYEAVQLLRPHPKIRPMSNQYAETATPSGDRSSRSSGTVVVNTLEDPRLYTSRKQYEVANSRVLGSPRRLDTDVPTQSSGEESLTSSGLSPTSIAFRVKGLFNSRSSVVPSTSYTEKRHGTICRTKSVVNSTLRRDRRSVTRTVPEDVLRSGFCSASTTQLTATDVADDETISRTSTISDEPPQLAPIRPVSNLLPTLAISIFDDEIGNSIVAERDCSEDENDKTNGPDIAPLHLHSSQLASASRNSSSENETSFYYNPNAKEDDRVSESREISQVDRTVSDFGVELSKTMESDPAIKTPSTTSATSLVVTPLSSKRLRHTALSFTPGFQSASLRSQYSASVSGSSPPVLNIPKMRFSIKDEPEKTVHVTSSVEEGLCVEGLKVYEEDAVAAAAPIVLGVNPNIVDIRRSGFNEIVEQQARTFLNTQEHDDGLNIVGLGVSDANLFPSSSMLATSTAHVPEGTSAASTMHSTSPSSATSDRISAEGSDSGANTVTPAIPFRVLETIVFSAAYGDAECRNLASNLFQKSIGIASPRWGMREQHLLCQSHLIQELDFLKQHGYLRQDIFETIRSQLFPTGTTEMMGERPFAAYIQRAVQCFGLDEERARQIVQLARDDDGFCEYSPEELFFLQELFNSNGFVYNGNTDHDQYERLSSMPSTVGTFVSTEPWPQSIAKSSHLMSRIARIFQLGRGKRAPSIA